MLLGGEVLGKIAAFTELIGYNLQKWKYATKKYENSL